MKALLFHTHQNLTKMRSDRFVFVFGSNIAGIHGAGAARVALHHFGAKWGKGYGLEGTSFAIPTKDENIEVLSLNAIHAFIDGFIHDACDYKDHIFILTEIGCGLAGMSAKDVAPLFAKYIEQSIYGSHINNIVFPKAFSDVLVDIYNTEDRPHFNDIDTTNLIV